MSYEIPKGRASFRYGISNPNQLLELFHKNPKMIGVAFVGRSNAGKSSLINTIFGKSTARVSKTPGRTREINTFSFPLTDQGKVVEDLGEFALFDLPGYGFADVPPQVKRNWEILIGNFFESLSDRLLVLVIQDARHPNQKADLQFLDYMKSFKPNSFLILNKLDKLKKQSDRAKLNKQKKEIFTTYKTVNQIHFVSAEKGTGVQQLKESIVQHLLLARERQNLKENQESGLSED